jgi:hypothetical protein
MSEPVNERPLFPTLHRPDGTGVSMWSVSLIRQLVTVFQQYGYKLNQTVSEDALADELSDVVRDADITDVVRDADITDVLREGTSGVVIQQAFTSTGDVVSTTSVIPYDDTIPQITEGAEALSISFTPKRADSRLRISAVGNLRADTDGNVGTVTLFVSTQSDALAVGHAYVSGSTRPAHMIPAVADIASPGTSAVTISMRFGPHLTGTMHINATTDGVRRYGGASATTLEVMEYMP